jgi:uncharacterized protein (TIGR02145 family)
MKTRCFLFAVAFAAVALMFFACSSDNGNNEPSGGGLSSSDGGDGSSSSNGGGSSSSSRPEQSISSGSDVNYGDETYKTVIIGEQTWFARNLNIMHETGDSWCYGGDDNNCTEYGRLYNWAAAMKLPSDCNTKSGNSSSSSSDNYDASCAITSPNHQGLCPSGFHIPTEAEWNALKTAIGGEAVSGYYLKATDGWYILEEYNIDGNGADIRGFAALPGGGRYQYDNKFYDAGKIGLWWSATEQNYTTASRLLIGYGGNYTVSFNYNKANGFSVRCLKDPEE